MGSQPFLLFFQGDKNLFCHQLFCLLYLAIVNLFISAFCDLFSGVSTDGSSHRILLSLWLLFPHSFLKIYASQPLQFQSLHCSLGHKVTDICPNLSKAYFVFQILFQSIRRESHTQHTESTALKNH